MDPATTVEQARFHYAGQTQAKDRLFLSLRDGGHFPSVVEIPECLPSIYRSAFAGNLADLRRFETNPIKCKNGSHQEQTHETDDADQ